MVRDKRISYCLPSNATPQYMVLHAIPAFEWLPKWPWFLQSIYRDLKWLARVAQSGQLKFLHKFWLSGIPPAAAGGSFNPGLRGARNALESHRRQPVDRSIPAYGALGMLSNPTGGSRWIVQSQPARPIPGNKAWD